MEAWLTGGTRSPAAAVLGGAPWGEPSEGLDGFEETIC